MLHRRVTASPGLQMLNPHAKLGAEPLSLASPQAFYSWTLESTSPRTSGPFGPSDVTGASGWQVRQTPALHPVPAPATAAYAIRDWSKAEGSERDGKENKARHWFDRSPYTLLLDAVPPKAAVWEEWWFNRIVPFWSKTNAPSPFSRRFKEVTPCRYA
jgi:hypothetical protein